MPDASYRPTLTDVAHEIERRHAAEEAAHAVQERFAAEEAAIAGRLLTLSKMLGKPYFEGILPKHTTIGFKGEESPVVNPLTEDFHVLNERTGGKVYLAKLGNTVSVIGVLDEPLKADFAKLITRIAQARFPSTYLDFPEGKAVLAQPNNTIPAQARVEAPAHAAQAPKVLAVA